MSVKVRAVHAGEFGLTAHDDAASAAHARPIDHDRVHADDRLDAIFLGEQANELHHDERPDRDDEVILLSCFDPLAQHIRH